MEPVNNTFKTAIRAAATLVVAGIVAIVAVRVAAPSGVLHAETDFLTPAPFLSILKPSERVEASSAKNASGAALIGSPVYIDLAAPDAFDRVTVSLRYVNEGQPVVEIGALGSSLDNAFIMHPAQHRLLDMLSWPKVSSGSMTLLQRTPKYASVDAFLKDPPSASSVALYRADADIPYRIPGYAPSSAMTAADVSLRGSHRMLTYVDHEALQFTFAVQDMNRQEGADPVTVSVHAMGDAERALARTVLADDGDTSDDQHSEGLRTVSVTLTDPAPGAYRIVLTASDDVFIRSIRTPQQKLAFEGRLSLGDHIGFSDTVNPVTVSADGTRMTARTSHDSATQTLRVDGHPLEVAAPFTAYPATLSGIRTPHTVVSPKRDVLLETDGVFALSEAQYFDPLPFSLQWYTDEAALDRMGIAYILTTYEPPVRDGDMLVATAEFATSALATTDLGAYRFVVSAPGLEESGHALRLERFSATLRRPPSTLRDAFQRLFTPPVRPGPDAGISNIVPDGTSFGESIP